VKTETMEATPNVNLQNTLSLNDTTTTIVNDESKQDTIYVLLMQYDTDYNLVSKELGEATLSALPPSDTTIRVP
jgi:hypothetical protein